MLFKIRRKTTWNKHYDHDKKELGIVSKPTTKIELTLFGLIPLKTYHKYRSEYDGLVVEINNRNEAVYTSKTREKFLKSKSKHSKTKDFVINNLKKIARTAKNEETKELALKTINKLKEDKNFSVNITQY